MAGYAWIPNSTIARYAEREGIDDSDRLDRFKTLIRAMDKEFIAWAKEQSGSG